MKVTISIWKHTQTLFWFNDYPYIFQALSWWFWENPRLPGNPSWTSSRRVNWHTWYEEEQDYLCSVALGPSNNQVRSNLRLGCESMRYAIIRRNHVRAASRIAYLSFLSLSVKETAPIANSGEKREEQDHLTSERKKMLNNSARKIKEKSSEACNPCYLEWLHQHKRVFHG